MYIDNQLAVTIDTNGTTTNTYEIYGDHLGSTRTVTDDYAQTVQSIDYEPFGAERTDTQTSLRNEPRHYIGQEYDQESSLLYDNARYYDGGRGEFLSQDPVFLSTSQNLGDPQSLNSYSYAGDNPVTRKDSSGKSVLLFALYGLFWPSVVEAPTPGQELATGQNLRTALFVGSFAPVGGDGAANLTSNTLIGDGLQVGLQAARQDALNGVYKPLSDYVGEISTGSYPQLKRIIGTAGNTIGNDFQWHHVIEQRNATQLGQEIIQNTKNIVALPKDVHKAVSSVYSSKSQAFGGQVMRQAVSELSSLQQLKVGLDTLSRILSNFK